MKTTMISFIAAMFLLATPPNFAKADDAPTEASPETQIQTAPPAASIASTPTDKRLAYDIYRRDELKRGIPRTRNALIGTSVAFGVGLALLIPVWTGDHCVSYSNSASNTWDYTCDTTGKVLTGIGAPLAWGGALGMIVSGIMLGVRKGKVRRLDERIMLTSDRRLQWDISRSRLVF